MIVFKNPGVIDMRAIKTFGVSVKKDGAIGFFGTGLKYAIAILLREGCEIEINAGPDRYVFDTVKATVTGEEFDIVRMNGDELGFTTELGKTWELWKAIREIYCNCTDEGGYIYAAKDDAGVMGTYDETVILVRGKKADTIFKDIGQYILQTKPAREFQSLEIHHGQTHSLFYKKVRVTDKEKHCLFTYNVMNADIDLTEDRTAKYTFQFRNHVCEGIVQLQDEDMILMIVTAPQGTYEHDLDYSIAQEPSEAFLNVCRRLIETQAKNANRAALNHAKKFMVVDDEPKEIELDKIQARMLEKAISMLTGAGYPVTDYPIKCVQTMGDGIVAMARKSTIYISELGFQGGTKEVAHCLLEEYLHLSRNFVDETRQFQTFLFKEILNKIEILHGEAF